MDLRQRARTSTQCQWQAGICSCLLLALPNSTLAKHPVTEQQVVYTMSTLTVHGCKDQLDTRCKHECVPVHFGTCFNSESRSGRLPVVLAVTKVSMEDHWAA